MRVIVSVFVVVFLLGCAGAEQAGSDSMQTVIDAPQKAVFDAAMSALAAEGRTADRADAESGIIISTESSTRVRANKVPEQMRITLAQAQNGTRVVMSLRYAQPILASQSKKQKAFQSWVDQIENRLASTSTE